MSRESRNQTRNPGVTAVVHRLGDDWIVVAADTQTDRPRLLDAARFTSADGSRIRAFVDQHEVGSVICVVPAASVVSRMIDLPDVPEQQFDAVLNLQAEARLGGIAPAHRIGCSALPAAPGESDRKGVLLAWPEAADAPTPPLDLPLEYAPDIAGIVGLIGEHRPAEPLILLSRADGSVGIAMPHSRGVNYRAAQERATDAGQWRKLVGQMIAETAMNAGHTDAFIESLGRTIDEHAANLRPSDATLIIPDELQALLGSRISGGKDDPQWWSRYGIAIGVLLARTSSATGLTTMRRDPPQERPSRVLQALEALSQPRVAITTIAACLILAGILPTVFAAVRLQLLRVRHSDLNQQLELVDNADKQLQMYDLLKTRAWPMTKLLADIAVNAPRGIEVEVLQIAKNETFSVSGVVSPADGMTAEQVFAKYQANLDDTRVFTDVTASIDDRSQMQRSYEFNLQARVTRPHRQHRYGVDRDYVAYSMQDRVDGKPAPVVEKASDDGPPDGALASAAGDDDSAGAGAADTTSNAIDDSAGSTSSGDETGNTATSNSDSASDSTSQGDDANDRRRADNDRGFGSGGSKAEGASTSKDRGTESSAVKEMPELLSEEQIAVLDRPQTMSALADVAEARTAFKGDEEKQEVLSAQMRLLLSHLKELPKTQ